MKLAKKNVLVINIYCSNRDNSGNVYSKIANSYLIKPDKNQRVNLKDTHSSLHSDRDQVAKEYIKDVFNTDIRYISDFKNIVVNVLWVSYKELKTL